MIVPLLLLLAATLAAARARLPAAVERALASRWAPLAVGAVTAAVYVYTWRSLNATPVVHDEAAYVLQSRIFAQGRWTGPPPPLPRFWEQFHVFVTPRLASKYPPGHSLLMAPGAALGLPGLVPVLLDALSGALLFALARRASDGATALLALTIWLTARGVLLDLGSFYSETTTTALWLAGWWALLEWRRTGRPGWLCALAAMVAWGGITRPLTAVVYALPVGVVVLREAARGRRWGQVAAAAAVGLAVCAIVPLWSARTLGSWRLNPYSEYSRVYQPFDRPGFGPDTTPARRALPRDMAAMLRDGRAFRAGYVPAALPWQYALRLRFTVQKLLGGWKWWLLPFALVGLLAAPAAVRVAFATALLLTVAYLSFASRPPWVLYYQEALPVLAALVALGLAAAAGGYLRVARRPGGAGDARILVLGVVAAYAAASAGEVGGVRRAREPLTRYQREFDGLVAGIPDPRAVVFVRYGADHNMHAALVRNEPDWRRARVWVVYDRGADDLNLLAVDPGRAPYLYDEATGTLRRVRPAELAGAGAGAGSSPAAAAAARLPGPA